ncbi:hypothetical protein ACFS7Z_08485 [Pontibacter toksunensis]|uniref:Uncharacterized protein n=1 Tax=Pontibacter toksunensis TaxID=1332631 RepID=A0ABW6BTS5_9BACT
MQIETILTIAVTSLIWVCVLAFLYYKFNYKTERTIRDSKDELKKVVADYQSMYELIMSSKNNEIKNSYDKGFLDAETNKGLTVIVAPWKEEIENNTFWKNKKSLKVGYKYQLFSNGIPCFEPHITVVEEISLDNINNENVSRAFENLESILAKIPNVSSPSVKVLGDAMGLISSSLTRTKINAN